MLEIARYEAERRRRGTVALTVGLSILSLFFLAFFPSMADLDLDAYAEAFPPAFQEAFGIQALGTIEGFLAVEIYQFLWLLLLGLYLAYTAGGLIAGDVERDRMDLLLSLPVSRARVLGEKFVSLLPVLVTLNVVVPIVIYGGVAAIGESLDPVDLAMVHLLSIPYLLACAGIGLVLSTAVRRADVARRGAIAAVFALFLVDSVSASSADFDWVGAVSPTYHYNPTEILVEGTYDITGAGILLALTAVLLALALVRFRRNDVGA